MARASRSAQQEKNKPVDAPPPSKKSGSKKRKRESVAPTDGQPATKQVRTDVKEEDIQEAEDGPAETSKAELPSSGDVPIKYVDAEKILDVLEMIDTQGLLDRVFPLASDILNAADMTSSQSANATSTPMSTQTFSLRALLKDSSQYPLRVLRSAVQHLLPISSHPRSRPSPPAAQQSKFCQLALSLLDKASFNSAPISLDTETILLDTAPDQEDVASSHAQANSSLLRRHKYALSQHLPTGSWFTSLNSSTTDAAALASLPTAHAELVSILPSSSASFSTRPEQTLGTYVRKLAPASHRVPGSRRVSCGKFLDYGPYASFAPSFDQDGVEVGRATLGEVVWHQQRERRLQAMFKGKQRALPDVIEPEDGDMNMLHLGSRREDVDVEKAVGELLPPEDVAKIKAALGSLELEAQVQELLERNTRALQRLDALQRQRLGAEGGGSSPVLEDSEEWAVAQGIMDSLALLVSLRPRSSEDDMSLVPPEQILRKLYRTLPVGSTQSWYGSLPEGQMTALRDDTTVHIKPGASVPAAPAVTTATVAAPSTPATANPSTAYNPYSYTPYNPSQYRSSYTYGSGSSYYPGTTYTGTSTTQPTNSSHYPNAQYQSSTQPYSSYSSWYQYQPQSQAAGATSARATPTPQATTPSYASFFANQGTRVVANTVAASKLYPAGWGTGQAQGPASPAPAVTLPPHLRNIAAAPSTPTTPGTGYTQVQTSYYQPATPAAR